MRQDTKQKSLVESILNVVSGIIVGFSFNIFLLPIILGIPHALVTYEVGVLISLIYASISLTRTYLLRRIFTKLKCNWTLL